MELCSHSFDTGCCFVLIGTAEADEVDARAMEILESIAKMTAPVDTGSKASLQKVLQALHGARDKHIFRFLSTITSPDHSGTARARALEELPKRTRSLGDGVAPWVKNLVKRCAMGSSLNCEIVRHCVLLAHECFRNDDVSACGAFLATVKIAVDVFPALGSHVETYSTLTELFSECRAAKGDIKKELINLGIVTVLSSILSAITAANPRKIMVRLFYLLHSWTFISLRVVAHIPLFSYFTGRRFRRRRV